MESQPANQTPCHLFRALNSLVAVFPYEPALTYTDSSNLAGILRRLQAGRGVVVTPLAMYKIIYEILAVSGSHFRASWVRPVRSRQQMAKLYLRSSYAQDGYTRM